MINEFWKGQKKDEKDTHDEMEKATWIKKPNKNGVSGIKLLFC